ncbi:MBL fold metallo-hydrolase [Streptomyces sp. NRRL F-4489]|uniref:MBL fold metallo-hydrolase n=1 Tax=Streptomyces sp. NRRL F-4489 TaxID=1609095 RepID=UPI0007482C30|nr:MBL fold metallo-hydrolase [Streptomyces sp. NRRL F-4489]KUL36839.1 MBL fold metallo-hydrolase [Streptomyces sp. NRRL F-4489]
MHTPPAHTSPTNAWPVGDLTIHRIDETRLPPQTGEWLLPDATADLVAQHDWLRPDFTDPDGRLRLHTHSFAVTLNGLRILIDTGIGNGKPRANPAWNDLRTDYPSRLTAAGFAPEDIDLVILTHLHADHVGWNTRAHEGAWIPTFPRARYIVSRTEREFWAGYAMDEPRRQMFRDSVHPVEEAGLLDLVDVPPDGLDLTPGLRLIPTPGHTPGHIAVELTSRGAGALITGDCLHHPVQFAHPAIGSCVDIDPAQAATTRRALLASLAERHTLVLGSHFPPPTAGRVIPDGDAYRLTPPPAT